MPSCMVKECEEKGADVNTVAKKLTSMCTKA